MGIDNRIKKLNLSATSIAGYQLLDENESTDNSPSPIGSGGSGIVFKARQILHGSAFVDRAIKFFMYNESILSKNPEKKPISDGDFISEIGNITTFNHQSLIRVIHAGFHECGEGKIPYIVTDYIDGTTLKNVIDPEDQSGRCVKEKLIEDPDRILYFLLDVAHAIKHIHEHGFAHCDIAPKNIFIQAGKDVIRPVLGDLGVSRPMKKEGNPKTRIIGSRRWMPERIKEYYDKEVDYKIFSEAQPFWDLYSFALTGLEILKIFGERNPRSWVAPLNNDLKNASDESRLWTLDDLIDRIEFLKPIHREVARVQELSMGVGSGRRKMMPVEALTTTKRLNKLIKHPAILRLSNVPQLTTANQILPGANHTRYEHTLGVIETMRRYILSLLDESEFLEHLSTKKIEMAILASSLYCATRFPLSNIVHEIKNLDKGMFKPLSKRELFLDLMNKRDISGVKLDDLIREYFENVCVRDVMKILCDERENFDDADKLVYSLLNNSLDVRVIDFVRRDSHHLGIISGDSFKIEEILPHVTIHEHELALKIEGVSIAEQVILLRYWLFSRVYWNRPNRIFCAMARVVFVKLHECEGFCVDLKSRVLDLNQREMVQYLIENTEKYNLVKYIDLSKRLLGEEHLMFRVVYESSRMDEALDNFHMLKDFGLIELKELSKVIENNLIENGLIDDIDEIVSVIVDFPMEPRSSKMGQDVKVRMHSGGFKNLHDVSGVIKGVNQSFEDQLSKFRVFIHPELYPKKEKRDKLHAAIVDTVSSYLKNFGETLNGTCIE